jgi:hypothetical protein
VKKVIKTFAYLFCLCTQDDHITLSVYMYQGPTGSLPPISVEEGQSAEIVQTFSSFPAPASDRVMWHLDLPEGMLVIHPGEEEHDGQKSVFV